MSDEYPYGFEDAARFHGMVICLPMHDWRTGGEEYMYGVLDSQFGHPWVHMRYYPGRESPSYHQSSFRLFKYKVVGSYGFWEPEEREQQQARDMANFHFRLATKAECEGMSFAYLNKGQWQFAEDHPELLEQKS